MKKILLCCLLISGCSSFPVQPKFPNAPETILEPCSNLVLIEKKNAELSDVLQTVSVNYTDYYVCKAKTDKWIEWYKQAKEIYK